MNTISNNRDKLLHHYMDKYLNINYIMYIFGEADVRIHFHKQIKILNIDEDEDEDEDEVI
jgi:hypothetical protein